jgi:starch phosphorylase
LAGDHWKAASDLGVPVVGVGLLYQQGYFRQSLDSQGNQLACGGEESSLDRE